MMTSVHSHTVRGETSFGTPSLLLHFYLPYVCVCICAFVHMHVHAMACLWKSEEYCRSALSLSVRWVPRMKLRSSGLTRGGHLQSHLAGPGASLSKHQSYMPILCTSDLTPSPGSHLLTQTHRGSGFSTWIGEDRNTDRSSRIPCVWHNSGAGKALGQRADGFSALGSTNSSSLRECFRGCQSVL